MLGCERCAFGDAVEFVQITHAHAVALGYIPGCFALTHEVTRVVAVGTFALGEDVDTIPATQLLLRRFVDASERLFFHSERVRHASPCITFLCYDELPSVRFAIGTVGVEFVRTQQAGFPLDGVGEFRFDCRYYHYRRGIDRLALLGWLGLLGLFILLLLRLLLLFLLGLLLLFLLGLFLFFCFCSLLLGLFGLLGLGRLLAA